MKARLNGHFRELREEGAAIMEHDGGLSRRDAEHQAAERLHLPSFLVIRAVSACADTARGQNRRRFAGIDATQWGGQQHEQGGRDI
jgi:hypothetical protein